MSFKLFLLRKTKALFIRFKLHRIVEPFSGAFLNLVYLSKFSKWAKDQKNIEYNDFYSGSWDYTKRFGLYEYILKKENLLGPIVYLEFGVAEGPSFTWMVQKNQHPDSRFYGFDTFEGLPEDWGHYKVGAMGTDSQLPNFNDSRVRFLKGLFQDTLPDFLKSTPLIGRKVIMMDADLYSSTLFVLTSLHPHLSKGDIIFFDEFVVPTHEFMAFTNFLQSYYMKLELIGAANNYYFAAFIVR